MNINAIDLFCGIGGLSFGLRKAGISVLAGLDIDDSCKFVYEKNTQAEFIHKDISDVTGKDLDEYWQDNPYKILAGCAPCQPFSTHSNKYKDREKSNKWHLINEIKRLVFESSPDIVTIENVPNLAKQKIFKDFLAFFDEENYFVSYAIVNCLDYGIPQKRKRLVLLASKFGEIMLIPSTHSKENYVSLKQAIGHLPSLEAGEISESDPLHRARNLSEINMLRMKASRPNGTWEDWNDDLKLPCHKKSSGKTYKSVYGRMSWDEPSSTITTQFYNFGTGRFGHPSQNRAITIREAAIIQTFPQDYVFYKNEDEISFTRLGIYIGNAVPVDLGVVIGKSILAHMREYCNER